VYCYFNDEYVNDVLIHAADRGFLLGDGLFETMFFKNKEIHSFKDHWSRLKTGLSVLNFQINQTPEQIKQVIIELVRLNDLSEESVSIRLTITRGSGPRGLLPPEQPIPTLLITTAVYKPIINSQYHLIIAKSTRRNQFSPLSRIKSLNYLDNILVKMEAKNHYCDDAIMLNTSGNIACTSAANVFMITDDKVITPPITDGVLPGITRKKIMEFCKNTNIKCIETSIAIDDLKNCDSIFITNSLIGIQSVNTIKEINNSLVHNHPIIDKLVSECVKK